MFDNWANALLDGLSPLQVFGLAVAWVAITVVGFFIGLWLHGGGDDDGGTYMRGPSPWSDDGSPMADSPRPWVKTS